VLRTIILLKLGYIFNLNQNNSGGLCKLFGFEPKLVDQLKNETEYKADITRGAHRIIVHCFIVEETYKN